MLKFLALAVLLLASGYDCRSSSRLVRTDLDTISQYIKAVLENLREVMPQGIPELSIPPLEPLVIPMIDVPQIQEGIADVKLQMSNLRFAGLSRFNVDEAKGDLSKLGVTLDMYFPILEGQGMYDLNGKILIFPLFGKGRVLAQINDLRVRVSAAVNIVGTKVQLSQMEVDSSFSQIQMYLEGIVGGGNLGDVINNLLNSLGKLVYDQTKSLWLPELNRIIKEAINNELEKVDLQDIIGGITPLQTAQLAAPVDNSANRYVDLLMEELRPHIANMDPLGIPDQIARFSKRIVFVTVWGSARLTSGRISGLTTIHRAGDCSISGAGISVTIECLIGVNGLNGGFNANAEFMGIGVGARADFGVSRVRVRFRVSADIQPGATANLDIFNISEVSSVGVRVSGLGPLNWILSSIANVVVNAVKGQIISAIEGPVRQQLRNVLGSVQIPNLP